MLKLIEQLEARVKELESFIAQSLGNHHSIVGRLEEAKIILDYAQKAVSGVEEVVAPEEVSDAAVMD
jgi:hypothetical protein